MAIFECTSCKKPFDIDSNEAENEPGFRGLYRVFKCPGCNTRFTFTPAEVPCEPVLDHGQGKGIEKARALFAEAGLAFPTIPEKFAIRLVERGNWLFSTREIAMTPYNLAYYVHEAAEKIVEDYVVLSHAGRGANSYAVEYYVVDGAFRMFLLLGWGGAYMDAEKAAAQICGCFSLADKIVAAAQIFSGKVHADERLTIVASDFYGSHWLRPGQSRRMDDGPGIAPAVMLAEVLDWLTCSET